MDKIKKFTCLKDEGEKADDAIEGSKRQVLAWMKKTFPGLRKVEDEEMVPAWQFFYSGDSTIYKTADGMPLYLVEMGEEYYKAKAQKDEKSLEAALKNYRECRSKRNPESTEAQATAEKKMDLEVAAKVAKAIWDTAHLTPQEQEEKLSNEYMFWNIPMEFYWGLFDVVARLVREDIGAAKELLCEQYVRPNFAKDDDNGDILMESIWEGEYIHFQMTPAFGGLDAYIVFRKPETREALIIRFSSNFRGNSE